MTVTAVAPPVQRSVRASLPSFALAPVLGAAALLVVLELAVAARYGYHRDELYFLACARHLAWGYVDQPPFVPAVARVATALFGTSVVGLRMFPALAGGAAVVFTALTARELGGGRRAQTLSALAAATSAQVLATVHLLSTAAFDLFFWSAVSLLAVRLLRTRDQRLWLAIGAVTGVALLNKYNIGFLVAALVFGLLAGDQSWALRGRYPWAGAAIALLIWSPNLVWNAQHSWASLAMLHALHEENASLGASISFIPLQVLIVGPLLFVFWLAGLRLLFRHPFARPIAVAYVALLLVDVLSGAKPYYLGGIYFALFAAGGVWFEQRVSARSGRHRVRRMGALMLLGAVVALPLTLPVLPVGAQAKSGWEGDINKDLSATVGWKRVVRQLDAIARTLPASERAKVVVLTGDYGAAGAVDLYGGRFGLPHAISGHNNYWWWGTRGAAEGATVIAVNLDRSYLQTIFASVISAGAVDTGYGIWTEERGAPIFICRYQTRTWARIWPGAKHYG
jgi:4-amino-4-deoxy-L-arabinose transferase-like glycosyltransferase